VIPAFPFFEIDDDEQELGVTRVLQPLNSALSDAADRHGWTYVDGVAGAFAGHGYCAEWPDYGYPDEFYDRPSWLRRRSEYPDGWYQNPGTDRLDVAPGNGTTWYRTATQSVILQGPDEGFATEGTMHPNELGHQFMADLALDALSAG
jgi:hypothetical protein